MRTKKLNHPKVAEGPLFAPISTVQKNKIDVDIPVLVCYSNRSSRLEKYSENAKRMEIVVNVDDIRSHARKITRDVTEAEIDNVMREISLSEIDSKTVALHYNAAVVAC